MEIYGRQAADADAPQRNSQRRPKQRRPADSQKKKRATVLGGMHQRRAKKT